MAHPSPDHRPSSNRRAMSSRRRPVRTMIVLASSGALLLLGTATATAQPDNPQFPFGNHAEIPGPEEKSEPDRKAEKAEELGGGLVTGIIDMSADLATRSIDMSADLAKCGLNVFARTVRCDLTPRGGIRAG
jgi:hypothetical protein